MKVDWSMVLDASRRWTGAHSLVHIGGGPVLGALCTLKLEWWMVLNVRCSVNNEGGLVSGYWCILKVDWFTLLGSWYMVHGAH